MIDATQILSDILNDSANNAVNVDIEISNLI